jgi:hypothetical protein
MHTVYIHIDENLDHDNLASLQSDLRKIKHITDVEVNDKTPHDVLVEFEEQHISPMAILDALSKRGVHADIMSG